MMGEKLMKLRRKQGLSQQEVADLLGVTRQTISNWECGQGAPALDKARALAELYRVSLDDLVGDEVEVVTGRETCEGEKDLHVLFSLKGCTCKVAFNDAYLMTTVGSCNPLMTVLDATPDWLRVEYERWKGPGRKESVVQLIDVEAVGSVTILGGAS